MASTAVGMGSPNAQIVQLATDVLDDSKLALEWLLEPNLATDNIAPIDYLKRADGFKHVENVLMRIRYGILA